MTNQITQLHAQIHAGAEDRATSLVNEAKKVLVNIYPDKVQDKVHDYLLKLLAARLKEAATGTYNPPSVDYFSNVTWFKINKFLEYLVTGSPDTIINSSGIFDNRDNADPMAGNVRPRDNYEFMFTPFVSQPDPNKSGHNIYSLLAVLTDTRHTALMCKDKPLEVTSKCIDELFTIYPSITDSFSSNSHYCISVLVFVESMILAVQLAKE